MKITKLITILLMLCMFVSLFSCAKKTEEESAQSIQMTEDEKEQPSDSERPSQPDTENEENLSQDKKPSEDENPSEGEKLADDKKPEPESPGSTDKQPEPDNKKPEPDNKKPEQDSSQDKEEPVPDETQKPDDNGSNNAISYDPSKYYVSSKEDIVMGNEADLFAKNNSGCYTAVFYDKDSKYAQKYMSELTKNGFKKHTGTSFNGTGSATTNTFATYKSDAYIVDVGYHSQPKRLYVTYTPIEIGTVLAPTKKPEYKSCGLPTTITQVGAERFHPTAVSMCYIIRAADGSFIVYDSDFGDGMAELIYDVLKKQAPDPDNIVISAWFITHPHLDHVGAFIDFADKYSGDKTITLKQVVYNYANCEDPGGTSERLIRNTPIAARKLNPDVEFMTPHAGNVLYYADLTFRILYTQDEYLAPTKGKITDLNGASIVSQLETDSGVKVLLGADHPVNGSYQGISFCEGALYNWYGTFIRSDIVTHFHHGFGGGADSEIFKYIKPKIVLWPATFYRLKHDSDGTPYANIEFNSRNLYFSDPKQAKQNGVLGYYISGDKIHIVDLSDKKLSVTEYEHCDVYLGK